MIASFTSCEDKDSHKTKSKIYYAYFEFSDDILEIYNITIDAHNYDLDKIMSYNINSSTPFKRDEQLKTNSYFIKCDTGGKPHIMLSTLMKKTKEYSFFMEEKNIERRFNMHTGFAFHEGVENETENDVIDALYNSCTRNVVSYSGAMLSAENPAGPPLYEYFSNEFIRATERYF